jgi:A/G-specific adenine glycosylase
MNFASQLLSWFYQAGRKDLPWQKDITPYRVWISEIMLQQTQVSTVIPYYERFMTRFPDIHTLAEAASSDVLQFWAGLGYYARGRNLHKTAVMIVEQYHGVFPEAPETLISLPGIGKSTAHAILAIAFGQKLAILDGNVKRVLTRFLGIQEYPGLPIIEKQLWAYATKLLPDTELPAYTQAIMDLGATLCTKSKPNCPSCPVNQDCQAFKNNLTADIPAKKPKKAYPTKTQHCLVLYNPLKHEVFLETRKNSGIWGGLNTPLFFEDEAMLSAWCDTHHLDIDTANALKPRVHKFTHFQLNFTPWLLPVDGFAHETLQCYSLRALEKLALPAPIKTLFQEEIAILGKS